MNPVTDEQLKRKSNRAFRIGVVFAFAFAITWGFPSGFGATTFFISLYCFFLSWYWYPRAQKPTSGFSRKSARQSFASTVRVDQNQALKQAVRFAAISIFGLIVILTVADIVFDGSDDNDSVYYSEDGSDNTIWSAESADWLTTGNAFYESGQYDSAEFYYNLVLEENPDNAAALFNKGLTYYQRQNPATAAEFFEQAYDQGMSNSFLFLQLGSKYETMGNTDRAVNFYKQAVEQDSAEVEAYARLAILDPANAARYIALQQKFGVSN